MIPFAPPPAVPWLRSLAHEVGGSEIALSLQLAEELRRRHDESRRAGIAGVRRELDEDLADRPDKRPFQLPATGVLSQQAMRMPLGGIGAVEPTAESEQAWGAEASALANATLFPRTDSWWTGANVPGKPRYFSAYLGGSIYYQRISEVADKDYEGFVFEPSATNA